MNNKQLQEQIISTLEKRPHLSVIKAKLPTEVLRDLGIDVRRKNRKKFENKVLKVLDQLIKKKAVIPYKATNPRVKLHREYRKRLHRENEEPLIPNQSRDIDQPYDEYEPVITDLIERKIPGLPDEDFTDDELNTVDSGDEEVDIGDASGKDHRLKIFLGENKQESQEDKKYSPSSGELQKKSTLQNIKELYDQNDNIDTRLSFSELKLKVTTDSGFIIVIIDFYGVKNEVIIKSLIPYFEEATFDILKLFSHIDFMGTLCIEEFEKQLYFSVRTSVDLKKFSNGEIISLIDQIITESQKVEEIIDRYL